MKNTDPDPTRLVGLDALSLGISFGEPFTRPFRDSRAPAAWATRGRSAKTVHVIGGGVCLLTTPPVDYGRRRGGHRLDVHDVGRMSALQITSMLAEIVTGDPLDLKVNKIELTADIRDGITMGHVHCFQVRKKHKTKEFLSEINSHHRYETIYHGAPQSGDFHRFYNKKEQLRAAGCDPTTESWVRLERVFHRGAIPRSLSTLRDLFANGASFAPFDEVRFTEGPDLAEIDPALVLNWRPSTPAQRRNALYALTLVRAVGRTRAAKILRREGRHAKDTFELLDRAILGLSIPLPSPLDLNLVYQTAFRRQMSGAL